MVIELHFGLTKDLSINLLLGWIVLKFVRSMLPPGELVLSLLHIFPSKIYASIGEQLFFQPNVFLCLYLLYLNVLYLCLIWLVLHLVFYIVSRILSISLFTS